MVLSQEDKVVDGLGSILRIERNREGTHIGLHRCDIGLCRIDGHSWCATPLRLLQRGGGILWTARGHRSGVCGCLRLLIGRRSAGSRGYRYLLESGALLCCCVCQQLFVVRGKGNQGRRGGTRVRTHSLDGCRSEILWRV